MASVTITSTEEKKLIISAPQGTKTITVPTAAVTYAKGQAIGRNLTSGVYGKYNSGVTTGFEQLQGFYVGEDTIDTTSAAKTMELLSVGELRADMVVGITLATDYSADLQMKRLGIYLK